MAAPPEADLTCSPFHTEVLLLRPRLLRVARGLRCQAHHSDDLVQETLCRAFEKQAQFRPGTNLWSWLYTIMRNLCLSGASPAAPSYPGQLPERGEVPGFDYPLLLEALHHALAHLPTGQGQAWLLYWQGHPPREVARQLGLSPTNARQRIFQARQHLRRELAEWRP